MWNATARPASPALLAALALLGSTTVGAPADGARAPAPAGATASPGVAVVALAPRVAEADTASPYGLREFVRRVVGRSLEVQAARERRTAAGRAAASRRRMPNPVLEAEGPDPDGVAQLQLRQPLRLFGQQGALRRLGDAEGVLAEERVAMEHLSVARDAARRYLEAVAARRRLSLSERILRLRREGLERARAALRRGWGGRERLDRLRQEARAAARETESLRDAVRRDTEQLNRLLGRPAGDSLRLGDGLAGDPDRRAGPPVPDELPRDVPGVSLAEARTRVARAELARARTVARPVPAVGPMVSLGEGVDPGVSAELSLPVWNRNRQGVRAARSRLEASQLAARATERSARTRYRRLVDRRDALGRQLERLRSGEMAPARRAVRRWRSSRELGIPVAERLRRARLRLLELRRREVRMQRRLSLVEVEAAWRGGSLQSWIGDSGAAEGASR